LELVEAASLASHDYSDLLLLYSAVGNLAGMEKLAEAAAKHGKTNVAFVAHLLTGNVEACAELLVSTKRLPEAAMFVRTYLPSKIDEIVSLWKNDLSSVSETAAEALAAPKSNPALFPDLSIGLQVEQMFLAQREATKGTGMPATEYPTAKDDLDLNLIQLIKARQGGGGETKEPEPADAPDPSGGDYAVDAAAELEAAQAAAVEAELAAAAAEAERLAAEAAAAEAAAAAAEEAAAAEAAAANTEADDFGDDW
jgi:coatomer subunit beta'